LLKLETSIIRACLRDTSRRKPIRYEDAPGSPGSTAGGRSGMSGMPGMSEDFPPDGSFRIGRNDPCPCGSGKKYKKYCAE